MPDLSPDEILNAIMKELYRRKLGMAIDIDHLMRYIPLSIKNYRLVEALLDKCEFTDVVQGFGNYNKVRLNSAGIDMMARNGSYLNFLATRFPAQNPSIHPTTKVENPNSLARVGKSIWSTIVKSDIITKIIVTVSAGLISGLILCKLFGLC